MMNLMRILDCFEDGTTIHLTVFKNGHPERRVCGEANALTYLLSYETLSADDITIAAKDEGIIAIDVQVV